MPYPFRNRFLLLLAFASLANSVDSVAQSWLPFRKSPPPHQQRVSGRFSTPTSATTARATSRPATPTTTQTVMQRQTFMDGQTPIRRTRNWIELSLHLLPTLTWNSIKSTGTTTRYESPGASLQYSLGPSADLHLGQEWYAFSTGLWYTTKKVGVTHPATDGGGLSTFTLSYVQLPMTMKLFSDRLIKAGRTYVQGGLTLDVKVAERAIDPANNVLYQRDGGQAHFKGGDVGLLLAGGYIRQVGPKKAVIISVQYQRGLLNTIHSPDLVSKNNLLALGAGLRF